jgi:hypothetical protein
LLYKQYVKLKFKKLSLLLSIFVSFFCLLIEANAQKVENEPLIADKREIIESLLKEKFDKSPEKTIYISTINLSTEIQNDFPTVKNKKIQFISPENSANSGLCAYEFGKFEVIDKFVSVAFGDCNSGLAYDFIKFRDKWKSVGLIIIK